jgi:hypothetical protein
MHQPTVAVRTGSHVFMLMAHALLVFVTACGSDSAHNPVGVVTVNPPVTADPIRIDSLTIVPPPGVLRLNSVFEFQVMAVRSDRSRVPASRPEWSSSANEVLTIVAATGVSTTIAAGDAVVTVRAEGLVASIPVQVRPRSVAASGAITVTDFSVIEFEYESAPGQKFYAPQMLVSASESPVTVTELTFRIPGLADPIPSFRCGGRVVPGVPELVNGEVYGDWAYAAFGPGRVATGEEATAIVAFTDSSGANGVVTIHGPVVKGALPTTYTGGIDGGLCFNGYRGA